MTKNKWDYIIVGTGLSGSAFGYSMVKAGAKVLFLEKGLSPENRPKQYRGNYTECLINKTESETKALISSGRNNTKVYDSKLDKSYTPFIGCGTGGSSALYGMVMERFQPEDFMPASNFSNEITNGSQTPAAWPITYQELQPYYEKAEAMFKTEHTRLSSKLNPANSMLNQFFKSKGLNPYQLSLACDFRKSPEESQGFLSKSNNKKSAENIFLKPALESGATLWDACEVLKISSNQNKATNLIIKRNDIIQDVSADHYILTAGALFTPALLLKSANYFHRNGLGNHSDYIGRCLMRHYIDIYGIKTGQTDKNHFKKQLGLNDFYFLKGDKGGTLQSFGNFAPIETIISELKESPIISQNSLVRKLFGFTSPLIGNIISSQLKDRTFMAFIQEDLPYLNNKIYLRNDNVALHYSISLSEKKRINHSRKKLKHLFKTLDVKLLKQAENNKRIAHACGTCRFGEDPQKAVLNRWNKLHEVTNVSVLDTSFFPSSAGTNPSLTLIANSLRVADKHLNQSTAKIAEKEEMVLC